VTLLITAAGAGIFFGLYYNFLILIPTTLVATIVCSASALLGGHSASSALLAIVIPAISLQAGYMVGLAGRDLLSQFLARLNGAQSKRV
jgi:hypothetical protein